MTMNILTFTIIAIKCVGCLKVKLFCYSNPHLNLNLIKIFLITEDKCAVENFTQFNDDKYICDDANANNTYNLGSTSLRWATIYTNDLELSNKGSQNSVDGTWGDWTLQEGENDIFMINNRNGKKFKINLTEVSDVS